MRLRRCGQWVYRLRMSAGNEYLDDADEHHKNEATDKQVGGRHEGESGFTQTPKVEESEQEQYREAEKERITLQQRKRGDKRTDPSRDANRYVQCIIDHQRRGGKKTGVGT